MVDSDSKFRLVMLGRKITEEEQLSRGMSVTEETHSVGSAIFHESGE